LINEKVLDVLNSQINKEFYSAYLYLAISAYFDKIGLYGFSNWTKVQAKEEVDHGMILFNYIIDRNGTVKLDPIDAPEGDFNNPIQVFEKILNHEKYVTESINCVASMSDDECDLATRQFIDWYISEQVEEEANARNVIKKLKIFGDEKASLFQLDKELGERTYKAHNYNDL